MPTIGEQPQSSLPCPFNLYLIGVSPGNAAGFSGHSCYTHNMFFVLCAEFALSEVYMCLQILRPETDFALLVLMMHPWTLHLTEP